MADDCKRLEASNSRFFGEMSIPVEGYGRLWRIDWRRGRDSNPGYPHGHAAFRVRCFRPLSHLSAEDNERMQAPVIGEIERGP
ncbi:MAG: hypothetical protein JWO15_2394 [Sphingomonadales bacterium]|nr:hypothetical protein [Sphingomonadales bacterium]